MGSITCLKAANPKFPELSITKITSIVNGMHKLGETVGRDGSGVAEISTALVM